MGRRRIVFGHWRRNGDRRSRRCFARRHHVSGHSHRKLELGCALSYFARRNAVANAIRWRLLVSRVRRAEPDGEPARDVEHARQRGGRFRHESGQRRTWLRDELDQPTHRDPDERGADGNDRPGGACTGGSAGCSTGRPRAARRDHGGSGPFPGGSRRRRRTSLDVLRVPRSAEIRGRRACRNADARSARQLLSEPPIRRASQRDHEHRHRDPASRGEGRSSSLPRRTKRHREQRWLTRLGQCDADGLRGDGGRKASSQIDRRPILRLTRVLIGWGCQTDRPSRR